MGQVGMARWSAHLLAAKAAGVSVAHYAREHGLSRHMLYAAQRAERIRLALDKAGGGQAPKRVTSMRRSSPAVVSPFVPVTVRPAAGRIQARLPNGIVLDCLDMDGALLDALVTSLAGLPCSD